MVIIWLRLVFNSDASKSTTIYFSAQEQDMRRKRQSEAGAVVFYCTLGVNCACGCRSVVNLMRQTSFLRYRLKELPCFSLYWANLTIPSAHFMSKRNFREEQGPGLNFLLPGTLGTNRCHPRQWRHLRRFLLLCVFQLWLSAVMMKIS